jgi:CBS domain-containing protein
MNVSEIMAKSPAVCTPDTPIHDVARSMVEHDCGAIPVVESQDTPRPVGVITDRDIVVRLVAEGRNPLDARAADAMTEGIATVSPDMSLEACAQVMEQNQVRRVPVVDEVGVVIGIVSQADVVLNARPDQTAELLEAVSEEEELTEKIPMGGAYSS